MADLQLTELAGDDLAGYLVHLEQSYADDMHQHGGVPLEQAPARPTSTPGSTTSRSSLSDAVRGGDGG